MSKWKKYIICAIVFLSILFAYHLVVFNYAYRKGYTDGTIRLIRGLANEGFLNSDLVEGAIDKVYGEKF